MTHALDELRAERRQLPWVRIDKPYVFQGPDGALTLGDLFAGRSQLAIYHFMLTPGSDHLCEGCSYTMDHADAARQHFEHAELSFAAVSRYRPELELSYIVPTFLDKRVRGPATLHEELAGLYPERICPPVRYNVKLSEAPAEGKTIFEYAPRSPGARDYLALARRVGG